MSCRFRILQLAILVGSLGLGAMPALAQQAQQAATTLKMSQPARGSAKGHLTLRATLASKAGNPLSDRSVMFYQQAYLFGTRDALLGTAMTDSSGYAAIDYQPAESGSQLIKARFGGDPEFASAEASNTIQVRDAVPPYVQDALPLATVRAWLPLGLASLVLATWAVLIGVSLRTVLGIRAAVAQTAAPEQQTAFAFAREALEGRES